MSAEIQVKWKPWSWAYKVLHCTTTTSEDQDEHVILYIFSSLPCTDYHYFRRPRWICHTVYFLFPTLYRLPLLQKTKMNMSYCIFSLAYLVQTTTTSEDQDEYVILYIFSCLPCTDYHYFRRPRWICHTVYFLLPTLYRLPLLQKTKMNMSYCIFSLAYLVQTTTTSEDQDEYVILYIFSCLPCTDWFPGSFILDSIKEGSIPEP